ncbi:cyclophilin B precursor-like protein [Leptotrombidium deliense]|uniref:Peptidyl-prolyl cis-trans isomerase n=1 Tax=Leptotrombidium deliense TaxID=299467 RepID=A0A443RY58_9ACAR|nr:cyclophilin B precursor-like protein [Leptotrombidium deliense]
MKFTLYLSVTVFALVLNVSTFANYYLSYWFKKAKSVYATHTVKFDVSYKNNSMGSITLALFGTVAPKTVKNFLAFSEDHGYNGMSFKGTRFHRVIRNFMIQGGDVSPDRNGRDSYSIYGQFFDDENFDLTHSEPGIISLANRGKDTNGSQFFITTVATPWLDGKHTVFGKAIAGMDVVRDIESVPTDKNDKPIDDVIVTKSTIDEVKIVVNLNQ